MKKAFGIILLVVLALLTVGCPQEQQAGEDAKLWLNGISDGSVKGGKAVTLTVEKGDVDWFCWTHFDTGVIQTLGTDYNVYAWEDRDSLKKDDVDPSTLKKLTERKLENGKTYLFVFNVADVYNLYIHQPEVAAKGCEAGAKDFRGKIKVVDNQTWHYKDGGYTGIVDKNVELYITNNEPTATSFWQGGDYTVTELWPLVPTEQNEDGTYKTDSGSIWAVDQELKYSSISLSNGNTQGFLFPVEKDKDIMIAMYQPRRNTGTPLNSAATEEQKEENIATYFGKYIAYKDLEDTRVIETTSKDFGSDPTVDKKFLKGDEVFTAKSATGSITGYVLTDVGDMVK